MRHIGVACVAVLAILLGRQAWLFADVSWGVLHYPYELDYGEGIVWQQAALMFTPSAYGDITKFPMIVFHYTPLFHAASRLVDSLGTSDLLISGRAVSMLSLIGCCIASAGLVDACQAPVERRALRLGVCILSALAPLSVRPVLSWSLLMRVDLLSHFFSLTGLWFGIRAFRQPRLIYVASFCFLCAVFTKQNAIAAPAAFFCASVIGRPRLAARGIATCLVGGVVAMTLLSVATHGRILQHIFVYNVNRVEISQLSMIVSVVAQNPGLIASSAFGAMLLASPLWSDVHSKAPLGAVRAIAGSPERIANLIVMLYVIICTVMLIGIAKVGANVNYAIEWLLSLSILSGVSIAPLIRDIRAICVVADNAPLDRYPKVLYGPLLLAAQAFAFVPYNVTVLATRARLDPLNAIVEKIVHATKPVVSDDMVLVLRAGKHVEIEPAIAAELASVGTWDERRFVERIEHGEFAMFITENERGEQPFDSRYTVAVADAMARAYPVREHVAGYTLHLPPH